MQENNTPKKRVILTGDRPTGRLHVGHYVGSLKERVRLQNSGEFDEIYIMIADAQARWLQNGVYFAMLLLTLAAIFRGRRRPRDYGVFFAKPHLQAGIGLALGGAIILISMLFGKMPTLPVYMVCSQLLVAASEEMFWRGVC